MESLGRTYREATGRTTVKGLEGAGGGKEAEQIGESCGDGECVN